MQIVIRLSNVQESSDLYSNQKPIVFLKEKMVNKSQSAERK